MGYLYYILAVHIFALFNLHHVDTSPAFSTVITLLLVSLPAIIDASSVPHSLPLYLTPPSKRASFESFRPVCVQYSPPVRPYASIRSIPPSFCCVPWGFVSAFGLLFRLTILSRD